MQRFSFILFLHQTFIFHHNCVNRRSHSGRKKDERWTNTCQVSDSSDFLRHISRLRSFPLPLLFPWGKFYSTSSQSSSMMFMSTFLPQFRSSLSLYTFPSSSCLYSSCLRLLPPSVFRCLSYFCPFFSFNCFLLNCLSLSSTFHQTSRVPAQLSIDLSLFILFSIPFLSESSGNLLPSFLPFTFHLHSPRRQRISVIN